MEERSGYFVESAPVSSDDISLSKRARLNSDTFTSSSSSTPNDISRHPRHRMRIVKKAKREHDVIDASTITLQEIKQYFGNVCYHGCPSDDTVGEELGGSEPEEVLQNLLEDIHCKQMPLPSKTYQDLQTKIKASDVKETESYRDAYVMQPMRKVLTKFNFDFAFAKGFRRGYEMLYELLNEEIKSYKPTPRILSEFGQFLEKLKNGDNNGAQSYLCKVWETLLQTFELVDATTEADLHYKVRSNGSCKNIPVNLLYTQPDLSIKDLESDEEPEEYFPETSNITFNVQPDLLFETDFRLKENMKISQIVHCFTVEIKTSVEFDDVDVIADIWHEGSSNNAQELSIKKVHGSSCPDRGSSVSKESGNPETLHSSSKTSANPWSSRKSTKSCSRKLIFDPMKTQHFMELLALMKCKKPVDIPQVHAFGFYVVMHRVYVTGLHIQSTLSELQNSYANRRAFVFKDMFVSSDRRFRMVCTKYFNLLKLSHFEALVQFLKYLIYHQHKELDRF